MPQSEPSVGEADLHTLVERKLIKVFGPEHGRELLRTVLKEIGLPALDTTQDLTRLADRLQTRQGFEATAGAMLSVMAAVRRSAGY